jgi:hypothetical protein
MNLVIKEKNTFPAVKIEVKINDTTPFDLTGIVIEMHICQEKNKTIVKKLTQENGLTITDAISGKFQIDEQIYNLPEGNYDFDFLFIYPDGKRRNYLKSSLKIVKTITK